MNGKISSNQTFAIEVGLVVALFPGLANVLILNMSRNASLLSVLIATIIGFIPVLMITSISKKINNKSLKEYIIEQYGFIGHILNILLMLIAIFILLINSWLIIDFIISQFLTRTSYYFIAIVFFSIIAWNINKEIETTSRTIFILFWITIIIMILLWLTLVPYIKLDNLKPYIDVGRSKIIKSSIIYLTYTTLPIIYILDLKHIVNDKKNFEKRIVYAYIFSSVILLIFLFLIISVYTIDIATILTYPVYSLFKKVQILGFIERIENFAAIQIVVAFFIQGTYLLYYLKENTLKELKINKNIIKIGTYLICLLIPIISITIFKNYNFMIMIKKFPYVLSSLLIIIILLFLKKKRS